MATKGEDSTMTGFQGKIKLMDDFCRRAVASPRERIRLGDDAVAIC